jgi:hypothetical protein
MWDAIVPSLRFEILKPTSFLVYIDNIWKVRHKYWVRIEINLKFIHTGLYQNELWHGNDYDISHLQRRQTNNIYARWTHGIIS